MTEQLPPGPSAELWRKAEVERAFWEQHHQELRARYPDQFVAIRNGKIVGSGHDLSGLARDLEARGIKPREVRIQFVAATPQHLVL